MDIKIKTILLSGFTTLLLSCGGSNEGRSIDVSNAEVIGENNEYLTMSDGTATIMEADGKLSMKTNVSLKRFTSGKIELKENWTADLLDANGITLVSLECKDGDKSTLENLLNSGSIGDGKTIVFTSTSSANADDIDKASKNAVAVRFNTKSWKDEAKRQDNEED